MSAARARERNARFSEALKRANAKKLASARKFCALEFEPLWRPAPWLRAHRARTLSVLERADLQAAAKRQAFAWLSAKLGVAVFSFSELTDLELMRRAFVLIWNASIADVVRWGEAQALEAGCDG